MLAPLGLPGSFHAGQINRRPAVPSMTPRPDWMDVQSACAACLAFVVGARKPGTEGRWKSGPRKTPRCRLSHGDEMKGRRRRGETKPSCVQRRFARACLVQPRFRSSLLFFFFFFRPTSPKTVFGWKQPRTARLPDSQH